MFHGQWRGVIACLPTLFDGSGEIDWDAIATHIERLMGAGVMGFAAGAADGEGPALTDDARQSLYALCVDKADGARMVLAGICAPDEDGAIAQAKIAADARCSGLLVPPAPLLGAGASAASAYLKCIARATELPIVVDNDPAASRHEATPDMLAGLTDEPMIVAVRHGWPGEAALHRPDRLGELVEDRFLSFWGRDDLAPHALAMGQAGWISAAANIFPEEAVALYRLLEEGDLAKAREIAAWFMPLLRALAHNRGGRTGADRLAVVKFAMSLMDHGQENMRLPHAPLAGDARVRMTQIMETALDARARLPE